MRTKFDFRRFHDGTLVSFSQDVDGNFELTLETLSRERAILILANVRNASAVLTLLSQLRPHEGFQGHLAEVVGIVFDHHGTEGKKRVCVDLGFGLNQSIEFICDSFKLL
jgi:hypothetical protein